MRLTVLGSSSSTPRPGRACSSYLIEGAGVAIVADLGNGALGNLHAYRRSEDVDAVVISHMHADHFIDVIAMRYTLKYGPRAHERRVRLCLPPGGEAMLRKLVDAFVPDIGTDFLDVFAIETFDPKATLRVGDAAIAFAPTEHYVPTFAMRIACAGKSIAYSSDTAPDDAVIDLARGVDLFACEATLHPHEVAITPRGHLTARESGAMAHASECKHLLLTHYPAEISASDLVMRARAEYPGQISVADDNATFAL